MKYFAVILLLSSAVWVNAQDDFFDQVTPQTIVLAQDQLIQGEAAVMEYRTQFDEAHAYTNTFTIQVNDRLDYEIGELTSEAVTFSVVLVRSKSANTSQIELAVVYKKETATEDLAALDSARDQWMELCNSHQVAALVATLYHKEAYYFNRGRLLIGTESLTNEYSYMSSPNYSLQLTPQQVSFVSDTMAYELGRCSGSYPLPYLIVWQKQADNSWKILLDSNF